MVNKKNMLIRQWVRKNGAATFDLNNKNVILDDGLIFAIENDLKDVSILKAQCNKIPAEKFDFKNKDVLLTDGILFSIEKEIKKLNKVKDIQLTSTRGVYKVELTKQKYKAECFKCRIWFEELESIIEYFKSMAVMLNSLGYNTGKK